MSDAVPVLTTVLASRRSGVQVRRSAALALGRLLREETLDDDVVARARAALLKIFDKANDATLRGYTAVAVAGARRPTGLRPIREAIDHGGNAAVKPYCAIALGLAARTLGSDKSRSLRRFLAEELDKTHELDLGAALSIALGLARATEAEPVLRARLAKTSKPAPVRGSAAEGIGLLGKAAPESLALLKTIIREERSGKLLEDAVLALGLLGQRGIAGDLVKKLGDSESAQLQGRIMLALGHLDHAAAVDPLLAILNDGKRRPRIREFACVALGILGDRRPVDVLFALDAWFNLHATTEASSEFLRLY